MAGLNPLYPAPDKWRPGDNLLDNWYFVNPVNQEGNTFASSSNAHLIDRWKIYAYVNGTATVTDTGVSLVGLLDFGQTIESGRIPRTPGTEITISCLLSTGELFWKTQKLANNIASEDVLTPLPPYGYLHFARHWPSIEANTDLFYFSVNCETQFSVVAAMLEPGPEQHLAHKEGNAWVLNRVPDYREELAKCQAYYRKGYKTFAVATSASFAFTEMEYNMRAVPLALLSILDKDNNPINAVLHEATANGCNTLYSAASEFTAGETYRIEAELNANL